MLLYFLIGIVLAAGAIFLTLFLLRKVKTENLIRSLQLTLLLVKIPKSYASKEIQVKEVKENAKVEIGLFEQLISNLGSLRQPFVFEAAVHNVGEEIHFYLAVPQKLSEIATKQVQAIWSGASVQEIRDDYNIFNPHGATTGAYIKQRENYSLPIRTYQELDGDTFGPILGNFAKIDEIGEGAAIQVIVCPASKSIKKAIYKYVEALKKGSTLKKVFGHGLPTDFSEIENVFSPKDLEKEKAEKVIDEDAVKILEQKISKPLFFVNVRLLSSAASQFQANDILESVASGFQSFSSPRRNEFKIVKAKNPQKISYQFIFREFQPGQSMTLNSEEISSFFHFPISSTETPKVKWLKAKEAPPPVNMPASGTLIGHSSYRGEEKPVYITDEDRMRHLYVIGQTGTGKTTLISSMLQEDILNGKGVCIIDPHGEFAEGAMKHIPKERCADVVYFDPGNIGKPIGLNMLEYDFTRPEEKTFIVNEMLNIFDKLYDLKTTGGPMFEQYMRNALLLLMEDMPNEDATLVEIPRIFTDPEWRKRKLQRIKNPVVIDFWEKEAVKAGGDASLANMTPYITSKFSNFIANDYMRPIIGQPHSAFNFRKVMDEGKILLINLSKGRIGELNASLLGMIIIGKILLAALSRVDVKELKDRRPFFLYIDEFQNFSTDSIASILSEARKYGLGLTMAHQFVAQLKENIRDAVFGNVGSEIIMRIGAQDAEFLVKQFQPIFDQNDLQGLDNLNAYAKILIRGETSKPFNLKINTRSWDPGDSELGEKIKEFCYLKYGADRKLVEQGIFERLRT